MTFLTKHNVDALLGQFNKLVKDLHAAAETHATKSAGLALDAERLRAEAAMAASESVRASSIAKKIEALIS